MGCRKPPGAIRHAGGLFNKGGANHSTERQPHRVRQVVVPVTYMLFAES
jgi:hypothetical protein